MSAGDLETELSGERVRLLPEGALYWPRQATLCVADLHWGKAAAFRAAALPLPGGTTAADLERLDQCLARTGAERVMVLGDLLHARAGRAPQTLATIAAWRQRHAGLQLLLVRGNHDTRAGDPPDEWDIQCVDEPFRAAPFNLCHVPPLQPEPYTLAGHIHPAVTLSGAGGQAERLPAFVFGPVLGLLPAFGSFTGSATVRPRAGDRVFVLAGEAVLRVS